MVRIVFGMFVVLHGLVHLLYLGQSARRFELQPGMVWPDGSWLASRFLGAGATRSLASALLVLAALGFLAGGAGILVRQAWWRPVVVGVAVLSTVTYMVFWDGTFERLDNQGAIGILINVAIVAAVLAWERLDAGVVGR